MATQGPLYPGTTANLSNAGTSEDKDAWQNPGNVVSDNATEATIVAATYDSPDISQILVASNFNFNAVSGTINGITVEVDRRSIVANSGKDFRVQLAKGTTFASLVGNNKAVPATIWPTTTAVATYGGAADLWGATWSAADISASSFAVFLSCQANIANADVGVDYIRVTVTYTPPVNTTVTPGTASLTTSRFAPTVSFTANQSVTPTTASLTTSRFAPTVTASDNQSVTPSPSSLTLTTFAPEVTAFQGTLVTPGAASLSTAAFAPSVSVTAHQTVTPGAAGLTTASFAPTVTATDHKTVVPSPASLELTTYIPVVTAVDPKLVTPGTASLTTTGHAPTINAGTTVVTDVGGLTLETFAPTISLTNNQLVTPGLAALVLSGLAPTVGVEGPMVLVPGVGALALTTYAPNVIAGGQPTSIEETGITLHAAILAEGSPRAGIGSGGVQATISSPAILSAEIAENT